jgi:GNAT superfamily N-acetyltransferase
MHKAAVTIRSACSADISHLWPLLRDMGHTDAETRVAQRFSALLDVPDHFLPLALVQHDIVGYAWAQDYGPHLRSGKRTARLHDLYVAPAWRQHGAGRQLFNTVRSWCEGRAVAWLQWQASEQAVTFYARLGLAGDPCPDPTHPFYEIIFAAAGYDSL